MISTHLLDTTLGQPASQVHVRLERLGADAAWTTLAKETTDSDGRITFAIPAEAGSYRIHFGIEEYFTRQKRDFFFLDALVSFRISQTQRKYHVPLLLNPFGYSTYRGS